VEWMFVYLIEGHDEKNNLVLGTIANAFSKFNDMWKDCGKSSQILNTPPMDQIPNRSLNARGCDSIQMQHVDNLNMDITVAHEAQV
jgi:hypothetical protein